MAISLKKKIKDLQLVPRKKQDFDPEDDPFSRHEETSDSEDGSDNDKSEGGREHYESVAKSKLRKPATIELDQKLYGSRPVSRAMLENDANDPLAPMDESEDDPFAARKGDSSGDGDEDVDDVELGDITGNASDEVDDDDEIDSDDAFEEGDEETFRSKGFVFRGSGRDLVKLPGSENESEGDDMKLSDVASSAADSGSDLEMDDFEDDQDEESNDNSNDVGSDTDEDEDDLSARPKPLSLQGGLTVDREHAKSLLSADTATISASLTQAASEDAKKGRAVKQQYQTFDRFLDARIKLQKGLTAINELDQPTMDVGDTAQEAIRKAEEAALRLFSTIESLRRSIHEANDKEMGTDGKKRKRHTTPTTTTPMEELQTRIRDLDSNFTPYGRRVLDKWSYKTRSVNAVLSSTRSKLQADEPVSKLTTVLDAYLLSSGPKLVEDSKAQITGTTNTTTTTTNKQNSTTEESTETSNIPKPLASYQDTQFYQSLLRDLISTKNYIATTTTTNARISSNNQPNLNPWSQTPKIHRQVDRKASKGRKIRYTVHEKLENFMAATGPHTYGKSGETTVMVDENDQNHHWTDAAVREFFGSLMGMRNQLVEEEDFVGDDDDDGELNQMRRMKRKIIDNGVDVHDDDDGFDDVENGGAGGGGMLRLFG